MFIMSPGRFRDHPDAPWPNTWCSSNCEKSTQGTVSNSRLCCENGLPENANQASLGKFNNWSGHSVNWFAEMRTNSNSWQCNMLCGNEVSWLPASASFFRWTHWPNVSGNCSILLSVKINQRNLGGSEFAGTSLMAQLLNPIISRLGQRQEPLARW